MQYLIGTQTEKGLWDEAALHRDRLPAGVLSAISWLLEVLPALGDGALSESEEHEQQGGRGRDVTLGSGDATVAAGGSDDPRPVLIVTGLAQEARIAAGPGMTVICSSSDPPQLRALLKVVRSKTIRGVISFGVAGGLDPNLRSGDVVIATEVIGRRQPLASRPCVQRNCRLRRAGAQPRGPGQFGRGRAGDRGSCREKGAAFGNRRFGRRYGKSYRCRLRREDRAAVRSDSRHQRSGQPRVACHCNECDQAQRQHRSGAKSCAGLRATR